MSHKSNADSPAMPLALDVITDETGNTTVDDAFEGLTKREYLAGLAMQGYLAGKFATDMVNLSTQEVAKESVEYADALLDELAKNDNA